MLFAGIMIILLGVLNVIWGIAAIDNSKFFVANATFILSEPQHVGLDHPAHRRRAGLRGVLDLAGRAGRPLVRHRRSPALNVIVALLSISAYPFWGLAVFIVALLVIYGLAAYGGDRSVAE